MLDNDTTTTEKTPLIKIGGVWENKTKAGDTYLAGTFGFAKVLIFANKYKETDKHPDYNVYITAKPKPEEEK